MPPVLHSAPTKEAPTRNADQREDAGEDGDQASPNSPRKSNW